MPINPAIAMGYQAPKFDDPMNRLVQMEQLKAYQQNALAKQLEMQVAQEGLGQQRGLKNYLAGMQPGQEVNPLELAQFGKTGLDYAKSLSGFQKEQRLAEQAQTQNAINLYKEYYLPSVASINTVEDAQAWGQALHADPRMKPLASPEGLARIPKDPVGLEKWKQDLLVPFQEQFRRETMKQRLAGEQDIASQRIAAADARSQKEIEAAAARESGKSQLARDKFEEEKRQNQWRQQFEEWKASPETQMAVAENENYGKEMAKNNVLYQQKMPDVIQQAQLGSSLIDKMIGERKFDEKGNVTGYGKMHPGFESAVGFSWMPGQRFVPGTAAADFQAYFDQLKGQAFLQAFQTLKGGGSITVEEGKKATDAINRMSLAQSEQEFISAAREFQNILESGARRAQMKLEGTGIPKGRGFTYNPKGGEQARPSLQDIFNQ